MKRADLYALVWEKPVTHVAREFGMSDAAIRKICVKHGIPTPSLGYWAKLADGKKVAQTPLPPPPQGQSEHIDLRLHPRESLSPAVAETHRIAVQEELREECRIVVPTERPTTLHPLAAATEKVLRRAKPDDEGFVASQGYSPARNQGGMEEQPIAADQRFAHIGRASILRDPQAKHFSKLSHRVAIWRPKSPCAWHTRWSTGRDSRARP